MESIPSEETGCELQYPNSLWPALHQIQKEPDQQRRIGGDQQLYIGIGSTITWLVMTGNQVAPHPCLKDRRHMRQLSPSSHQFQLVNLKLNWWQHITIDDENILMRTFDLLQALSPGCSIRDGSFGRSGSLRPSFSGTPLTLSGVGISIAFSRASLTCLNIRTSTSEPQRPVTTTEKPLLTDTPLKILASNRL